MPPGGAGRETAGHPDRLRWFPRAPAGGSAAAGQAEVGRRRWRHARRPVERCLFSRRSGAAGRLRLCLPSGWPGDDRRAVPQGEGVEPCLCAGSRADQLCRCQQLAGHDAGSGAPRQWHQPGQRHRGGAELRQDAGRAGCVGGGRRLRSDPAADIEVGAGVDAQQYRRTADGG
ncbi:hypothetical protein D3C86_1561890 [compost metagenome]